MEAESSRTYCKRSRNRTVPQPRLPPHASLKATPSPSVVLVPPLELPASLLPGALHIPDKLWVEAVEAVVFTKNRTPIEVLDGKGPLEVWEDQPFGSLKDVYEWGFLAFTHIEVRH